MASKDQRSNPDEWAERQRELDDLRQTLIRTQRQLKQAKDRSEQAIEAAKQAAVDAVRSSGPIGPVAAPKADRRRTSAEVALWHSSDWQGAKLTASYNSTIMRQRVMRYAEKAIEITDIQRSAHPVKECAILFGGDLVEGLFQFPTQPFEIDATIFEQWATVSRLLIDVVRRALGAYDHVTVWGEWGNHGRIGTKRMSVPRSDNFDRMCYEHARQILVSESRLTWGECPEDIQRVELGTYRALLIHGDEVGRNGFASPSTIVQHVNRWRSGAYPWAFRDVYMGHYHTHAEWPLANGEGAVFQTGSTESDNRYAGVMLAASAQPSQRLHFVDPRKGRVTAQYKVHVDD